MPLIFVFCISVCLLLVSLVNIKQDHRMDKLQKQITCLKSPTSGASSVAGKFVNGKFVITRPSYKTVCP